MSRSLAASPRLVFFYLFCCHQGTYWHIRAVVSVLCVSTDDNAHEPFTKPNSCRQSLSRGSVWMNGGRRIVHPLMGDTNKSKG
ncbi:hypothetical protein C8R48DRAFT_696544 [Suillus tomentosus]|nr:hypothetical protein C8R48DRAFT_696544 [Suillus tomentosus]